MRFAQLECRLRDSTGISGAKPAGGFIPWKSAQNCQSALGDRITWSHFLARESATVD